MWEGMRWDVGRDSGESGVDNEGWGWMGREVGSRNGEGSCGCMDGVWIKSGRIRMGRG